MNELFGAVGKGMEVFVKGAIVGVANKQTLSAATFVGLQQGLKYKGDVKTGIQGGLAVAGVAGVANGVLNIVTNWEYITTNN